MSTAHSVEPFEKIIARGNLVHLQIDCKVLHEVRVYDKDGKLKEVISEKAIHRRHWKMAEEESKNKRFVNVSARKVPRPPATE